MKNHRAGGLVAVALSLATLGITFQTSVAQDTTRNTYRYAGNKALQHGRYVEAEKLFREALKEAEAFGPEDPRVATTLNDLALLYDIQGRYTQAEPLYRRVSAIWERALGPEHPIVAISLERNASLLRKMKRETEAAEMEGRAKAIRAKHAQ